MSFTFKEEHGNPFEVSDKYYLAHCVSTDCALGAGAHCRQMIYTVITII